MRWTPESAATIAPNGATAAGPGLAAPPLWVALRRGVANRCPFCGEGKVFAGFLKVVPECSHCHTPLGLLRADDAPPYFTIFLVGHLLVPPVFWVEKAWQPPMWLHMVIWLPLFAIACTLLLRPIKGGVVGWMSTLGFVAAEQEAAQAQALRQAGGPIRGPHG
ncbi:DUF983 domain-containing protein [Roseicella aerolata]|uniref:DUF983 domain-containing protein n=1 Tax=Roseicella aerolata TaxID=2883479 RepID=A0A9X1IGF0_9PROT|nr:DUF983 domain-containing protein [Roseicella aerolata]MCB4823218.1 DUF983 domain-containing protein [Roseicella aerolata]